VMNQTGCGMRAPSDDSAARASRCGREDLNLHELSLTGS
jgi:hypothetical protein